MRKIYLIVLAVALLSGCAWIKEQKANVNACYSDPVCFQAAIDKAKDTSDKAGALAGLSGLPWAERVAKPVAGYVVLIFTLAVLGKKKRKELPNG